jgi:hypothetical protein
MKLRAWLVVLMLAPRPAAAERDAAHRHHRRHQAHPAPAPSTEAPPPAPEPATEPAPDSATATTTTTADMAPTTTPALTPASTAETGSRTPAALARTASPPARARALEPLFSLAVFGDLAARRFQYHQPLSSNLGTYSTPGMPLVGVEAELYPLSRLHTPVVRGIGLFGDFGRSLYGASLIAGAGATTIAASWMYFDGGLRYRLLVSGARGAALVGVSVGAGRSDFAFSGAGTVATELPSTRYVYVRPALDLALPVWRLVCFGQFGYRALVSAGDFDQRFPRDSVGAIDAAAGLTMLLGKGFSVSASANYTRFFFAFHSQPGDTYVAGGALDEYLTGRLAVAYAVR